MQIMRKNHVVRWASVFSRHSVSHVLSCCRMSGCWAVRVYTSNEDVSCATRKPPSHIRISWCVSHPPLPPRTLTSFPAIVGKVCYSDRRRQTHGSLVLSPTRATAVSASFEWRPWWIPHLSPRIHSSRPARRARRFLHRMCSPQPRAAYRNGHVQNSIERSYLISSTIS